MNKQQLIDKAIDDLKGEWQSNVDSYLCRNNRGEYFYTNFLPPLMCKPEICTRQEFEARKAEREKESSEMCGIMFGNSPPTIKQDHWFDYENQKALRLPPVGEVVLFGLNGNRRKVAIVAHDLNAAIFRDETCHDDDVDYYAAAQELFRPIGWDKLRISAVNELAGIIESYCVDVVSAASITDAILAAGYRKCHNKTPSDKE